MDAKTRLIVLRDGHWTIECYPEEEAEPIGSPWWFSNVDGFVEMISQEAARKERERIAKLVDDDLLDIERHVENGHPLPPNDDPYWPASKAIEHIRAILTPESANEKED